MAEHWFQLSNTDKADALETGASALGRPAHLVEKDIWVVWTLSALYGSQLGKSLTFKGGTSLSKVFGVIDRFSEDIDLTYDIRELVPDLLENGNPIPASGNQEKKLSKAIRGRLSDWIFDNVLPTMQQALEHAGLQATLEISGAQRDKLLLGYTPLKTGTGYAASNIQLEFGARATGEPHQPHKIGCDIATVLNDVTFPQAKPLVMNAERTFWEKATAIHVYCLQGRLRSERYARHWYDLVELKNSKYFDNAVRDVSLSRQVAEHKSMFFAENDSQGTRIDYYKATSGEIQLVPTNESFDALERDYAAMIEDGLLNNSPPSFEEVMQSCEDIQTELNERLLA